MQKVWQHHKNQLGREAGLDHSLMKMSSGYRDSTGAHFRAYAALTLEELAIETGAPEDVLTAAILDAFQNMRHKMVRPLVILPACT